MNLHFLRNTMFCINLNVSNNYVLKFLKEGKRNICYLPASIVKNLDRGLENAARGRIKFHPRCFPPLPRPKENPDYAKNQ